MNITQINNVEDIEKISNGVIFDTDVLLKILTLPCNIENAKLQDHSWLYKTLRLLKKYSIKAYYPKKYAYEVKHEPESSIVLGYKDEGLLKDLYDTAKVTELKNKFLEFPFDTGEAYCYAFAQFYNLIVISDDKLAAYSYLVNYYKNEILKENIGTEELFERFYAKTVPENGGVLRFDSYALMHILHGLSDEEIKKVSSKLCRRKKEWFYPKDIAEENKKLKKGFKSIEKCYLGIGRVAASIYSLPKNAARTNGNANVGLKIKSSKRKIGNAVLTKQIESRRAYNFIAYNAILKYLKTNPFLVEYLRESSGRNIGCLKRCQYQKCKKFVEKFRKLYDPLRIKEDP